ncbi:MAG: hypothetical protein ABI831_15410 [Betaproteobacteria bacterium]
MRMLFLFALLIAASTHAEKPAIRTIDLGSQAGIDALAGASPAHRQKVSAIIEDAERLSCETLPKIIHARHAADEVRCQNFMIMTSDPPKRRLEFTLERTRYVAVIRMLSDRGGVIPLADTRPPPTAGK